LRAFPGAHERERKNLALALKDTRSVVGTLTYVCGAILQLCFFFFYLLVLRVRHLTSVTPVCSDHAQHSNLSGTTTQ
jgi:hypothetical protein